MANLENTSVDDMLINSFGMEDLGNIDIDKYQKGLFSPSPKYEILSPSTSAQTVQISSPQKPQSPHVVPHLQQQLSPRAFPKQAQTQLTTASQQVTMSQQVQPSPRVSNISTAVQQTSQHQQMQRKIQLGPNFDRLGILNQANEIPPMTAPFFAKALQQHGGTTLGAILQAHQHALQQQMQRENFLLQQQAAQQQMFQAMPIHNLYQQQRFHAMIMERRVDDQIVPNPQLQHQEQWLHAQANAQIQKQSQLKQEDDDDTASTTSSVISGKETRPRDHYFIFNDDHHVENMTDEEDEDKANSRIRPPDKSQFVRYQPEANRCLPTFPEAFTGHIEKLKLKEEQIRQMLLHHQMHYGRIPMQRFNIPIPNNNLFLQQLQQQQQQQQQLFQQHLLLRQQQQQQQQLHQDRHHRQRRHRDVKDKTSEAKQAKREKLESKLEPDIKRSKPDVIINTPIATDEKSAVSPNSADTNEEHKPDEEEHKPDEEEHKPDEDEHDSSFSHLDFLNDVTKDANDLLSCFENTKETNSKRHADDNSKDANETDHKQADPEIAAATEHISIFPGDLGLSTDNSYDNLFNGNSDEHYFQAFKDNNLHLLNDLNENKMESNDDILKLLHSPLDFINDKFLK